MLLSNAFQFLVCGSILSYVYAAVFPVPGSYYSLLLRCNNKNRVRKGPRVAPSPNRLWAYFDPPAALGSLYPHHSANQIPRLTKKRMPRPVKKRIPPRRRVNTFDVSQIVSTNAKQTKLPQKRSRLTDHYRKNAIKKSPVPGTCEQKFNMEVDPTKLKTDSKGRIFFEQFTTLQYPMSYPQNTNCKWVVQIDPRCQMGMIVHEVRGNLRSDPYCSSDFFSVALNGKEQTRLCGPIKKHTKSHKWMRSRNHELTFELHTAKRPASLKYGPDWGVHVKLSGYCWVYSASFHESSKSLAKQKHSSSNPHQTLINELTTEPTIGTMEPTLMTFSPFIGLDL